MKKPFTLFISILMALGTCLPVSANDTAYESIATDSGTVIDNSLSDVNGILPAFNTSSTTPVYLSDDGEEPTYSVSVAPDEIKFPSVMEGYGPQEPKYITIKNTGNQTILLELSDYYWGITVESDKKRLEPNDEATVTIKLKDDLSADTPTTPKTFITYTSEDGTTREHANFEVSYAVRHDMEYVEAKDATHLEDGNIACWYCAYCDKYYKNGAGTKELSLEEITVPKLKEHTATDTCHFDETSHWNTYECGAKLNEADHTFEWVTDKEATAIEAGSKHEECIVCGYEKASVEIPATGTTEEPSEPSKQDDLAVGLIALLRLSIFGMGEGDKTGPFKDIENRDPVLASRFHTDFGTGIFGKPGS